MLTVFPVTSNLDDNSGGTLREAIQDANDAPGPDTITFASDLQDRTINLTSSATLPITDSLTITTGLDPTDPINPHGITINGGGGTNGVVGNGDGQSVFHIYPIFNPATTPAESLHVTFDGLIITGGDAGDLGGGPADDGGGIYFNARAEVNDTLSLTISNSVIENNSSKGNGGGLWMRTEVLHTGTGPAVDLSIEGSIIKDNIAQGDAEDRTGGGGAYIWGLRKTEITDTKFIGNTSYDNGGGLHAVVSSNDFVIPTDLLIENSEFLGNTALTDHVPVPGFEEGGGGIWVTLGDGSGLDSAKFDLNNSTFANNTASGNADGGGAWIYTYDTGTFTATNSTFSANTADRRGGGLWISHHDGVGPIVADLNHLTITENVSSTGSGLYSHNLSGVDTTLYQTIVSNNRNQSGTHNNVGGSINAASSYNLLGDGVTTGVANIVNNDPKLNPLAYNPSTTLTQTHSLRYNSPAVDAGDPAALLGFNVPWYDQRGVSPYSRIVDAPRIDHTNESPPRGPIDIGAFELQEPCTLGADFDEDGDVDGDDFLIWQSGFNQFPGGNAEHEDGDATCDGYVDGDDFLIWQEEFGSEMRGSSGGPTVDFDHAVRVAEVAATQNCCTVLAHIG